MKKTGYLFSSPPPLSSVRTDAVLMREKQQQQQDEGEEEDAAAHGYVLVAGRVHVTAAASISSHSLVVLHQSP